MKPIEWLLGLTTILLLAWLFPSGGEALGRIPTVPISVVVIFFLSGTRTKWPDLIRGIKNWRFHLIAQMLTFGIIPAFIWICSLLREESAFAHGIVILGCLPTTISSCVVMTGMSGGDEPTALASSLLSNLLAVFLTPLLIAYYLGLANGVAIDPLPLIGSLAGIVLLPYLAGMAVGCVARPSQQLASTMKQWSSLLIFVMVYIALSRIMIAFPEEHPAINMFTFIVAIYFLIFTVSSLLFPRILPLSEARSLVFVGSQKSLAIGIPIVHAIDPAHSAELLLPLVIYHYVQLLLPALGFLGVARRR